MIFRIIFALMFLRTIFHNTFAFDEVCEMNGTRYICPLRNNSSNLIRCCGDKNSTMKCCEDPLLDKNDRLVMLVSITVILSCFLISALIIVCCFWSRCPLFDLCWVNYSRKGVIAYTKEGEALNEPPDENEYTHQYTPINIKISRVDDV